MIFLGIDPGLSGAIALWQPANDLFQYDQLFVHDMPTLKLKAGSDKRTLDVVQLARTLDDLCKQRVTLALIEQAGPRPRDGTRQAFGAGANWGTAYGALVAQYVPTEIVPPQTWKRAMGCTAAKDTSLARIKQLQPKFAELFARKMDEGRAEAALIALYAERRFRSQAVTP